MKIISLRFKNLNSLKGEFFIDFTIPALANAGLFAITGPTGAGKSTILDAITLSLYSYTPRLGRITDTVISEKNGIVTLGTNEAFAEIVFEVKKETYKTQWAIKKVRTGNWGKITFKLNHRVDLEFIPLTDKSSDTKAVIAELIGLTEEQFTQAIVLSQGKFDEFLKAGKDNRYKLLEIITGTSIFREIGKIVYQKLTEIDKNISNLKIQIGDIKILSAEELQHFNEKINDLKLEAEQLGVQNELLSKIKKAKESIENIRGQLAANNLAQEQWVIDNREFEPKRKQLERFDQAVPYQGKWNEMNGTATEMMRLKANIKEAEEEHAKCEVNKLTKLQELSTITGSKINADNFESTLQSFFNKIDGIDRAIENMKASIATQTSFLDTLYKQIPSDTQDKIKPIRSSVNSLQDWMAERQKEMERNPLPDTIKTADLPATLHQYNIQKEVLINAIRLKKEEDSLLLLHADDKVKKKNNDQDLSAINILIKELADEISNRENELKILKAALDANSAVMSLDIQRNSLVDGDPCPCCGATVHPYSINLPVYNNQLEEQYNAYDESLKLKRTELVKLEKQLGLINNNILHLNSSLEKLQESIDGKKNELALLLGKLSLSVQGSWQELTNLSTKTQNLIDLLNQTIDWQATERPMNDYIEDLSKLDTFKEDLSNKEEERRRSFSQSSIQLFRDQMFSQWQTIMTGLDRYAQEQDKYSETLVLTENKYDKQLSLLVTEIKLADFSGLEDYKNCLIPGDMINALRATKNNLDNKSEQLIGGKLALEENLKTTKVNDDETILLENIIAQISEKTAALSSNLMRTGELNQTLTQNELTKQTFQAKQESLEVLEKSRLLYATLNNYVGDATGNKFNSIIQRITLRHLFAMANNRLLTLMDRYQLDLGGKEMEDEIWIIDTHMGDEKRTIEGVSGGERFVISLALSLALSDLASQNVRIDSMFIDEGFGSLSPDDLDNAISMLERMQVESEKTIGIISHVESLKERINTQIQVVKLQNGESTLNLMEQGTISSLRV